MCSILGFTGNPPLPSSTPYETDHERGNEGPGWRLPSPSPPYEVEANGQWFYGLLRMWEQRPDGWYGLIRWADNKDAHWVPASRLRPTEYAKPRCCGS